MNDQQFRQRRITVERDDESTITRAYDADTDESILVDPKYNAIFVNRKWYRLAHNTTHTEILSDTVYMVYP